MRFYRIICSIYSVCTLTNVTVTHMIRISIFFLAFFFVAALPTGRGQGIVNFTCYDHDRIAWEVSAPGCTNPVIDSLFVFIQESENSPFNTWYSGTSLNGEIRDDVFKTAHAVYAELKIQCPDRRRIGSDTISLAAMREAVQLDSVRVLTNGDVRLTWKNKPISGVRYIVNSVVSGSSSVLASGIQGNSYTDTRGLAGHDIEYYSVSASLACGYTFPEPDSFYHTSWLTYETVPCESGISFEFKPFSYWQGGTASSTLFVVRNDQVTDSVDLAVGDTRFRYEQLDHGQEYTFYVREAGHERDQVAYSNPITFTTNVEEPIRWIVIGAITINNQNQATILWTTNNHTPTFPFKLHKNGSSADIPPTDLHQRAVNQYEYTLPAISSNNPEYKISLQDSCGNTIESRPKKALLTQGKLNGGIDLQIQWTDVSDEEWHVDEYVVYYVSNGGFSFLGSVDGSTTHFQHAYDENNPIDSVCYYVVARGEVFYAESDSTTDFSMQSNTVCLHGETIVELPNAYHSNEPPYRPIIVPQSNITSYNFRIFDRYGSLVFETNNPAEGWQGQHQGKEGFADVYVVQVELTNNQGEQIKKSGSLLLFP